MSGLIYTLDLATLTGWAKGRSGDMPLSGVKALKKDGEQPNHGRTGHRLVKWLADEWSQEKPWLVVVESLLPLGGFAHRKSNEANVKLQIGLHMAARIVADMYDVRLIDISNQTVRKHFIGFARFDKKIHRGSIKDYVVDRCHLLKYMGSGEYDDNQADALAMWDWACAHYARARPTELHLFKQR